MTRQEFLHELRIALQGEISQSAVNEHINYYENYIIEESRKGRSEEEVIARMGNPRLIAKTLKDTTEQFGQAYGEGYYSESDNRSTSRNKEQDIRHGGFRLNSWYGKLLLILFIFLLIFILINMVAFLLPIVLPVVLIFVIISLILGKRR